MLRFDQIVFGPVHSRRLGSSLGINLLPFDGKLCNFDCIYCECGWNRDGRLGKVNFPEVSEVGDALKDALVRCRLSGLTIDSITFSGNGEPTLHPDFPEIVDQTLSLRSEYFPDAAVSVLSNATMIARKEIFEALRKVDNPILKIDAATMSGISAMNRPAPGYSLEKIIGKLKDFNGNFVLQTMFLKSPEFDSSSGDNLAGWMEIVRRTMPRKIMVYTIDRETPEKDLIKFSEDSMREFVRPLIDEGFDVQING